MEGRVGHLGVVLLDQVEQVLLVLLNRLDGGYRAQTTPASGRNGGPWDREMPGESPRASAEHLLPQAVVVGTARLWRRREDGCHRGSIARRGSASEILSDSEGGALAYRKLGRVFARSWARHRDRSRGYSFGGAIGFVLHG
jgi:hypothetical protein